MITVIIPTYKNKSLLLNNLRNNLKFLTETQIIVINDDPTESLEDEIKNFDKVELMENSKNLGFSGAVNRGILKAQHEYILLLNSDTVLKDKSFEKALLYFAKNKKLFAVGFAQEETGGEIVGKNKIVWKKGLVYHTSSPNLSFGKSAWAEGGACMIDKAKFDLLGGFDELYSPFYWEDIDLSYRAWKAGYEVIFDPAICVKHYHESTIGKYFEKKDIRAIAFRNQHIFIMKNMSNKFIFFYFLFLPFNMIYYLVKGKSSFISSFFKALIKLPKILEGRQKQNKYFEITDDIILVNHS